MGKSSAGYVIFFTISQSIYFTNRFRVAVRQFSNRPQMTSKCGKNKKVAHKPQASVSPMSPPHFDVFCDLLERLSIAFTANVNLYHLSKFSIYLSYTVHCNYTKSVN